jgi:dimethylargininase
VLRAIVRPPARNFAEGLTTCGRGAPVYEIALEQHEAYCQALQQCGLVLTRLEADPRYPDSTFVEDTAVLTERLAIISRPGAPSRAGETYEMKHVLAQFYPEVRGIAEPGTLDCGDVCPTGVNSDHFFIGISERTNEEGAWQLGRLLDQAGYTYALVNIRHIKGLLHLKSGLACLGDGRLVVVEELANQEAFSGFDLIPVAPDEEYAANCVQVNKYVLVASDYPVFVDTLSNLGYETLTLEMSEFQKMDGGLSCLSLRF